MISAQVAAPSSACVPVHRLSISVIVVLAVVLLGQRPSAQSLTSSLLQRYLEVLREQAGIPGMSALVLQDGVDVWKSGFGRADVEGAVAATPDTPYLIGGLSQTVGATLLLKECLEEGVVAFNDPVTLWAPGFAEPATVGQLLAHVTSSGAFRHDLDRFAALTPVIEACSGTSYQELVADDIFGKLAMLRSVPGTVLATPTAADIEAFGTPLLARYAAVLGELASPYRLVDRRAVRTELAPGRVNAANGIVSTVYDLARFDATLRYDTLLHPATLDRAWTPAAPNLPAGLGWFVQTYNGEKVVWQFGSVPGAYSALLVKVPNRGLTFILLANSDALAVPFARETWDVTASVFARAFLLIYVP